MLLCSSLHVVGSRSLRCRPCKVASRGVQGTSQVNAGLHGEDDLVVSVRTMFQTKWCCLEMIGSLEGRHAERGAQLAVIQEYYANRASILLSLVKHVGLTETDDLPFTLEKLEKMRAEDEAGNQWCALKLTLYELLGMVTKLLGADRARKGVAEGIDAFKKRADTMYEGTTPTVLTRTVQVCVGELFSKIDASVKLPDEPDTTEESGDTMGVRNDGGTPEVDASSIKNPFSAAASDQVITGEGASGGGRGFNMMPKTNIGLQLRNQLFLDCHRVFLDILIDHASQLKEIDTPQLKETSRASVKIRGGTSGPLDERISIVASGPGLLKLREQVATQDQFFTVHNGTVNPFEDLDEKNLQPVFCRVFQQYLHIPIPKRAWFSVLAEATCVVDNSRSPVLDPASSADNEPTEFLGLNVNSTEVDGWKYVALKPPELAGLIFGVSEYICNDFGIQSRSEIQKSKRYPSDSPARICWTPSSSSIELVHAKEGTLTLDLDTQKVEDLRKLCDEVISRLPNFARLNLPPSTASATTSLQGVWSNILKFVAIASILGVGTWTLSRSLGRKHPAEAPSVSKKTASVVKVRKESKDTTSRGKK